MVNRLADCLTGADGEELPMDEQLLPDLLRLCGSVVAASDEFFAAKENLAARQQEPGDGQAEQADSRENQRSVQRQGESLACFVFTCASQDRPGPLHGEIQGRQARA
jgi:hypothetical protein